MLDVVCKNKELLEKMASGKKGRLLQVNFLSETINVNKVICLIYVIVGWLISFSNQTWNDTSKNVAFFHCRS